MKIVRIIARLNVGGPARHVAWLTAAFRDEGHESLLVSGVVPKGEADMSYFARSLGVEPVIIPEMSREISPKDALTVWKLFRLFRRERPDIVHTHTAKAGTVGRVAGLLYRWATPSILWGRARPCRLVHTYHGHIFHSYYGPLKTRLFLWIERLLALAATDRIVVISPQQHGEIHERFRVGRRSQFVVIPLGLDLLPFERWSERRDEGRATFVADDGDLLVGIVGRLTEVKNHELFLEAVSALKERRGLRVKGRRGEGRVRFVVVGDGHLREKLEARARALGLADDVQFAGFRDDPERFYPALDVVALTSLNEGTPLTLIEAMANARPVVATGVGGVVDLLGEQATQVGRAASSGASAAGDGYALCERGVRVAPGDASAFARGLELMIDDEALRSETGERGRLFVERNYSLGRLLEDVAGLYDEMLSNVSVAGSGASEKNVSEISRVAARLKGE